MSDDPTQAELICAIEELAEQYRTSSAANEALAQEVGRRKRETRWVAIGIVLVLAVVLVGAIVLRHTDRRAEAERRSRIASQLLSQREGQVQGCERGNEGRRVDRETIEIAIADQPIPPDATPEEVEEIVERNARIQDLRDRLLSRPGMQIVDCQAAHPLPTQGRP